LLSLLGGKRGLRAGPLSAKIGQIGLVLLIC